jgi:hypothetical protein
MIPKPKKQRKKYEKRRLGYYPSPIYICVFITKKYNIKYIHGRGRRKEKREKQKSSQCQPNRGPMPRPRPRKREKKNH